MPLIAYGVCALIWGTTWYAIRLCLVDYSPFAAASVRFVIAFIILAGLMVILKIRVTRSQVWWLSVAGLFNGIGFALVYAAEESVPGSVVAVLFSLKTLFVAGLVSLTKTETVHPRQLVGAVIAIAGVVFLFLDRAQISSQQVMGVVLALGAVVASALYAWVLKQKSQEVHPFGAATVFMAMTALVVLFSLLAFEAPQFGKWGDTSTWAVLYLAVFGSVITFSTYIYLLKHMSLMGVTTLVFVIPLIALGVDALFEDEFHMSGRMALGAALLLLGVWVGGRSAKRLQKMKLSS